LNIEKLLIIALIIALDFAVPMWLAWKALSRVGLNPWLSLLVLFPGLGAIAVLAILAFGDLPLVRRASD
jgi:hypothetical protein